LSRITAIPLADWAIPIVDLSRRVGRLNRRERLEDLVCVPRLPRNDPRVPRLQQDHLALAVQLGASGDHIAHRLVIPYQRPKEIAIQLPCADMLRWIAGCDGSSVAIWSNRFTSRRSPLLRHGL